MKKPLTPWTLAFLVGVAIVCLFFAWSFASSERDVKDEAAWKAFETYRTQHREQCGGQGAERWTSPECQALLATLDAFAKQHGWTVP